MIVLDTHVLVWWANGDETKLSPAATAAIAAEMAGDGRIIVSSISAWELAMLVARGRLDLSMETETWLSHVAAIETVRFAPVDNTIAVHSVTLPGEFHKDPADRIIVATSRRLAAPLVTADEKIHAYPHVRTIW